MSFAAPLPTPMTVRGLLLGLSLILPFAPFATRPFAVTRALLLAMSVILPAVAGVGPSIA